MSQRLGILTSGGDCAGLNTVIRTVVQRAAFHGWETWGIRQGTMGLLRRPVDAALLIPDDISSSLTKQGGTFLGTTNKGDPFAFPMPDGTFKDVSHELIEGLSHLKLNALIGVGGDGSLQILRRLSLQGNFKLIGIPKTIDNDVGLTENSLGFFTAVSVATEALDRLQPTAASHDRVMILEVMGRDAGHIALTAGIAGGADIILIPEIPYSLEGISQKIKEIQQKGRNFALIVVAEAVKTPMGETVLAFDAAGKSHYGGIGHRLALEIGQLTGAETRCTVLGHVQRGAQPTAYDRVLAVAYGVYAVDLVIQGKSDRMVAWQNRRVVDVSLDQAIASYQVIKREDTLLQTAHGLGIYLGHF